MESKQFDRESNGYRITAQMIGSKLVINATHLTQKQEYEMTYYDNTILAEHRTMAKSCDVLLKVMLRATRITLRVEDSVAILDVFVVFV